MSWSKNSQKMVKKRSKNGQTPAGHNPAETGSSTGAPELRDLLSSCLFDLFGLVPFCPPIAARSAGHDADRCGQMQKEAEHCRKMHMAATGQPTTSTHPASKPGPAARASSPARRASPLPKQEPTT